MTSVKKNSQNHPQNSHLKQKVNNILILCWYFYAYNLFAVISYLVNSIWRTQQHTTKTGVFEAGFNDFKFMHAFKWETDQVTKKNGILK